MQSVEIFADHRGIVERRAIIEHECWDFAQRVVRQQRRIWRVHGDHGAHAIEPLDQAALVGKDHHLAHERRAGRPMQLHHRAPFGSGKCFDELRHDSATAAPGPLSPFGERAGVRGSQFHALPKHQNPSPQPSSSGRGSRPRLWHRHRSVPPDTSARVHSVVAPTSWPSCPIYRAGRRGTCRTSQVCRPSQCKRQAGEKLLERGLCHSFCYGTVQRLDDRPRRSLWRQHAIPVLRLYGWKARFARSGHVPQYGKPLVARDYQSEEPLPRTCGSTMGPSPNMVSTWPPMRSLTAGAAPR